MNDDEKIEAWIEQKVAEPSWVPKWFARKWWKGFLSDQGNRSALLAHLAAEEAVRTLAAQAEEAIRTIAATRKTTVDVDRAAPPMIDDIDISDEAYDALEAIILRHMPEAHGCAVFELRGAILDEWLPLLDRPQIEILDEVAAERERCARIADDYAQAPGDDTPMGPIMAAQVQIAGLIAERIRGTVDPELCIAPDDVGPVATEGLGDPADWAIDQSTGRPVLTYQRCSVIQDEQALTLMRLIAVATEVPF